MSSISENINKITDGVLKGPGTIDIESAFMSDKECLVHDIKNRSSSDPNNKIPLNKEEYKNKFPDAPSDNTFTAEDIAESFPDNHPAKEFIKEKKKEVKIAIKQLEVTGKEIAEAVIQLTIETSAAFVTIGSSAAILPLGAGLPTAFSTLQGIFSSLDAFNTKLKQLIPILKELKYVDMLVPEDSPVKESINGTLEIIKGSINGIDPIKSKITNIKSAIGGIKVPGSTGIPGITAPPEPIGGQIWGDHTESYSGDKVWINVNATDGTWDYNYKWAADNDSTIQTNNKSSISVYPTVTTKYTVLVKNKNGEGSAKLFNWTVTVKPKTYNLTDSTTNIIS